MSIVFFEVQEWEKEPLNMAFPQASLVSEPLTAENAPLYKDATVLSPFIYSKLTKELLELFPDLKCISTRSTGFDHIDVEYCKSRGIEVKNVPEYGSNTVAEHTFALILNLTRKIYESIIQVKQLNFDHTKLTGMDIYGKTIGIVGLGKIGSHVLRIANSFGMNALVYAHHKDEELIKGMNARYAELPELLSNSDVITFHIPLTPETKHIINKTNIETIKRGAYLINTARGRLLETEAIVLALEKGILAGVGLDVVEEERELSEEAAVFSEQFKQSVDMRTLILDHILINHPRVVITPHNAFNSKEALMRIVNTTVENIKAFLSTQQPHIV
jgi:D-lactate dehydrogenase